MRKLVNYIAFLLGWYGLVKYENVALFVVVPYLIGHVLIQKQKKVELKTIVWVSLIGITVDSLLTNLRVITFSHSTYRPPYWFIALWPLFSSMLNHCLKIMSQFNPYLNVLLGGVSGGLAYLIGETINPSLVIAKNGIIIISLVWSVLFPLVVILAKRVRHDQPPKNTKR